MANKVKYNLRSVHYAKITDNDGVISYGTPVAIPGAVSLSLDAQGDIYKFYADGGIYFQSSTNGGYEGDLEIALIPDSFRKDILGEVEDENGILLENVKAKVAPFALLFEFDGDIENIRHVLYNCTATRPSIASQTNEESIEVRTETLSVSAAPRADGVVKSKCSDKSNSAYGTWFTTVYNPVVSD